ncbi:hypothetical protein [Pseudonocardia sp. TRM90224]|uniref:hypothetical protein n=1 Tax=Pseudonocardia sp. TRM90224 TaxID=2812678 RepID=UPI001E633D63|nr:hypothetical protein [Pseudonocardia sp. TRM90224]
MSLDPQVPRYHFMPESLQAFAQQKAVGGGMFRAAVPTKVRVEPSPDDLEPIEHTVVMHLDVVEGRLVCTRLDVEMVQGGPSVTAEVLRRIPVGRFLREAAASGLTVFEVDVEKEGQTHPFVAPPPDFAEAGMTDDVLREVARLYHWALATGDAPLGLLEREYGVPRGKASRWISVARRRGYVKDAPTDTVEDLGTSTTAHPRKIRFDEAGDGGR